MFACGWYLVEKSRNSSTDEHYCIKLLILFQVVGCRSCPPYQCPLLGDLPTSDAGSCMARRHAACSTAAGAERRRKRGNQGAMSGLSNAAAPRYVAAVRFRLELSWFARLLKPCRHFLACFIICARTELITDMLGSEKYRLSLETMLESLQDHQINKWVNNQTVE